MKKLKLTLVSFSIGSVKKSIFIELEYKGESPILELDVLNSLMLQEFGYIPACGVTFTIG